MNRALLLIPASVVVIAGIVGALWALGSASGERAKFSSLEVAPAQADVFFALNTDPTSPQWLAVNDSLDSINAKDPIREAIDDALAEVSLEWDRDIAPVAGDEAFLSIPDITEVGSQGGWTAGVLLNDPDHAREVFDDLRERDDSPPLREEEYNGVTIWVTNVDGQTSVLQGTEPAFQLATPTPAPAGEIPTETPRPADEPFDGFFEPFFDCGGFGYNADGSPNEDAFGGEPCETDADYCLWWGFVPTGDDEQPYTTEPCVGTSSFCGNYGFEPAVTPSPDGLPCGDDFDFWFEEPAFDDNYFDPGDDPIFEYNDENFPEGEDIFDVNPTPDLTAIAFVDNVMALGGSVDDVKAVIDVVQGRADSALANERLQEFREQQKGDFLVWGYVDLVDVWAEVEREAPPGFSTDVDTDEIFQQLRDTYDRVGFSVSSFSDGFAMDFTVVHSADFDPEKAFEPTKSFDPAIAEILPEDTMFYFSGYDVYNQSWLPGKAQWEDLGLGDDGSINDVLEEIEDETGVDIESEVFALLTGEIAVAGNVTDFDDPEWSGFAIADVNDEETALGTLGKFEEYLEGQEVLRAETEDGVHTWVGDSADDQAAWYIKDGRFVIGLPINAVKDLNAPASSTSLADTDDWQSTMDALPGDKTFVSYLSIARILEEIQNTEDAEDTFESFTSGELTLADLEPIRALGMSGSASENGFGVHLVLFMRDE